MTLKEKYNQLKADYQEMIAKSDFTVSIQKQYLDRFRKTWKWADTFQLDNATPQITAFFADTLNFYGKAIATQVKKKAGEKQAQIKAEILASLDWADADKIRRISGLTYELADVLQNSHQLSLADSFHFTAI